MPGAESSRTSPSTPEMDAWVADHGNFDTSTYVSVPPVIVDLPEVHELSSTFFYNYYTTDERTATSGEYTFIDIMSTDQSIEFMMNQDDNPRSVVLRIRVFGEDAYNIESQDATYIDDYIDSEVNDDFIQRNLSNMVYEGAMTSGRYTQLSLMDDQVDKSFYNALESSLSGVGTIITDVVDQPTVQSKIDALAGFLAAPFALATGGQNPVRDIVTNTQPLLGTTVGYADTDMRADVADDTLRSVRFVEFTSSLNNLVIKNLVLGAIEDRGSIYQDELAGVATQAIEIQRLYKAGSRPSVISPSDYDIIIPSIDFVDADADRAYYGEDGVEKYYNESAKPIGLFIEKYEMQATEEGWERKVMDPIIINTVGNYNIFDPDVKYGATYVYKTRVVYLTTHAVTAVDPSGLTPDEPAISVSMCASNGVLTKVNCVETVAPRPPQNLSFQFDRPNNNLVIYWEEPLNPERDVVRYQLLRRDNINDPFELIAEYDFDNSTEKVIPLEIASVSVITVTGHPLKYYVDENFNRSSRAIYAMAASDARGLTSCYSEQIEVNIDTFKNSVVTNRISPPGAPKPYPNLYLNNDLFIDTMKSSGKKKITLFFDPEYKDIERTFRSEGAGWSTDTSSPLTDSTASVSTRFIGPKYILQIINLDLQDSAIFEIDINDQTGPIPPIPFTTARLRTSITS
tara:strand:+ start:70183 stop:72234 length:2052 start_codon:yes stop_codon:yes gene_type:complete